MKPDIVAPVPTTKEKRPISSAMLTEGDEELAINWKISRLVTISTTATTAPSIIGAKRWQRGESFKRLVNEEHRHINHKYGLQYVEKNCCRWLMFSNHLDAIPFDNTDRRVIVIANPTERKEPPYYEHMFGLLDHHNFIASVRRLLEMRDISRFRPGELAPMNDAKLKALVAMTTEVDRVVAEFKEDCVTELTSRTYIRDHVNTCLGAGAVTDTYLTHAIARAGMINAGRRVKIGRVPHSVVIVRGDWTPERVKEVSPAALSEIIRLSPF